MANVNTGRNANPKQVPIQLQSPPIPVHQPPPISVPSAPPGNNNGNKTKSKAAVLKAASRSPNTNISPFVLNSTNVERMFSEGKNYNRFVVNKDFGDGASTVVNVKFVNDLLTTFYAQVSPRPPAQTTLYSSITKFSPLNEYNSLFELQYKNTTIYPNFNYEWINAADIPLHVKIAYMYFAIQKLARLMSDVVYLANDDSIKLDQILKDFNLNMQKTATSVTNNGNTNTIDMSTLKSFTTKSINELFDKGNISEKFRVLKTITDLNIGDQMKPTERKYLPFVSSAIVMCVLSELVDSREDLSGLKGKLKWLLAEPTSS